MIFHIYRDRQSGKTLLFPDNPNKCCLDPIESSAYFHADSLAAARRVFIERKARIDPGECVDEILETMCYLKPEQRKTVIDEIKKVYCMKCGGVHE